MHPKKIDRSEYYWCSKLTKDQNKLIDYIESHGGGLYAGTKQKKTVRLIVGSGKEFGYINSTVHRKSGLMGYRSPEIDRESGVNSFLGGCNENQVKSAERLFLDRFSIKLGSKYYIIINELKNGTMKYYLIIRGFELAMKICKFSQKL